MVTRLLDPAPVHVEMVDEIGIAVHLSEGFRVVRRVGQHNRSFDGRVGKVLLYTPAERVLVTPSGRCELAQLRFPVSRFAAIALEDHGIAFSLETLDPRNGQVDHVTLGLLCGAAREPEARAETDRQLVARLLRQALGPRIDLHSRHVLSPSALRRVRTHVEDQMHEVSLASMAAAANLSPYHFARQFRRATGVAPWAYVVQRRLARAAVLLGDPGLSIEQVACSSGWSHASHLGKHLRRACSLTPLQLRQFKLGMSFPEEGLAVPEGRQGR